MNADLLSIASYVALWGVVCTCVWWLFEKVEDTSSPAMRMELVDWLSAKPTSVRSTKRVPAMFIAAFDRFFGKDPFTRSYLKRSMLVTTATLSIALLVWATFRPEDTIRAAQQVLRLNSAWYSVPWALLGWLAGAILISVLPDYVSLFKSRALIGMASRAKKPSRFFLLILLDVVLSAALGCIAVMLFGWATFLSVIYGNQIFVFGRFGDVNLSLTPIPPFQLWHDMLLLKGSPAFEVSSSIHTYDDTAKRMTTIWKGTQGSFIPAGVNFYATFFASIWMALFVSAKAWVRVYPGLVTIAQTFRWALDIRDKPFRSLGTMIVVWASAGFVSGLIALIFARL